MSPSGNFVLRILRNTVQRSLRSMAINQSAMMTVLDVRSTADFERLHRAGSANIPLEELTRRIHELPPRSVPVTIYDENPTRARWAASRLRVRERTVAGVVHGETWLTLGPTQNGPSRVRLWQPHELLKAAVEIASNAWGKVARSADSDSVRSTTRSGPTGKFAQLPDPPRALDIACGTGRDAVYLALCGFEVEAWDILPDAINRCQELAVRNGVTIKTRCRDVVQDTTIAPARHDLVCCFNFLHRPLFSSMLEAVRPGGLIVCETFVEPQRAIFGKPVRAAHVLQSGELLAAFSSCEVLLYREGLAGPRRYAASLIARRPSSSIDPAIRP